jgi:NitT/TauT family transport system permease protein
VIRGVRVAAGDGRGGVVRKVLPPIVVGAVLVLGWQLFVDLRDIKPYLLPSPTLIWDELRRQWDGIWEAARHTGANALVGLIIGSALGVAMAMIASRFRAFNDMVTPLAAAINAMPIVALAPIFNNIFGTTSSIPRRLVVTIVVFFPIFTNMLRGLTRVEPTQVELMRSYAASDSQVLRRVRLPNALPFFFTGLKLAASLCVIAAVVAEYFGGLQKGLGSRITSAASNSAYGRAWAYVVAACVLGLVFYIAAVTAERLAMPWRARRQSKG